MSYRSSYDTDVTTFSPEGRLHQVEYAMEAVNQGNAVVGICSSHLVVIASFRKRQSKLAAYQQKLFEIDSHIAIGISGLVADARAIAQKMRTLCAEHQMEYDSKMPAIRMVNKIAEKAQEFTQKAERRPYGVGVLVASCDSRGPILLELTPAGHISEYRAQAIGARCQSAKTVLEKNVDDFLEMGRDELVKTAVMALKGTTGDEETLSGENCKVAVLEKGKDVVFLEGDQLDEFLPKDENEENM